MTQITKEWLLEQGFIEENEMFSNGFISVDLNYMCFRGYECIWCNSMFVPKIEYLELTEDNIHNFTKIHKLLNNLTYSS